MGAPCRRLIHFLVNHACRECNQKKGNEGLDDFLSGNPDLAKKIRAGLKKPLADAAAMNSAREALRERLEALGLPVIGACAAETKYNRERFGAIKFHACDAACAGPMSSLSGRDADVLVITSIGRGHRRRERTDKYGFPKNPRVLNPKHKMIRGFMTGDFVRGTVTKGENMGAHVGRVTVQSDGSFYIMRKGKKIKFSHKNAKLLQRGDGYDYSREIPSPQPNPAPPEAKPGRTERAAS